MSIPPPRYTWHGRYIRFDSGRKSKGVHRFIRTRFFPGYQFKDLKHRPVNRGGLSLRRAKLRGRLVDRQLARCVPHAPKPCSYAVCETRSLFGFLNDRFDTWECQYPVGHPGLGLGTCIDVVGIDHQGKYTAVEVKCGCAYRHCTTMQGVDDSPHAQYTLQSFIGARLFTETTGHACSALVVYVDTHGNVSTYDDRPTVDWETVCGLPNKDVSSGHGNRIDV